MDLQGLKPAYSSASMARLKPCPDASCVPDLFFRRHVWETLCLTLRAFPRRFSQTCETVPFHNRIYPTRDKNAAWPDAGTRTCVFA